MEKSKDPGSRTRWAAVLTAGRRPRVVVAACALVLAAPLAVVAATGTVARADGGAGRRPR
jgi:cation transport ATPase